MSDEPKYPEEEELRRAIRAEIEQRDLERAKAKQRRELQKLASEKAELKRRIYREEMERYYADRPGYKKVIGEDGEPEWVHEDELKESEHLVEEIFEDPFEARKKQKRMLVFFLLGFIVILAGIYYLLSPGKGSIEVTSNIPGALIILDAASTHHYTNDTIPQVPAGEHYVSVEKEGYRIVGDALRIVKVKRGRNHRVSFVLEPEPVSMQPEEESGGSPAPTEVHKP
jgi:hypothetical protein